MPKKHVKSKSLGDYYARSAKDMTWFKNKKAKLVKHLALFPEDSIAKAALKGLSDMTKPLRGTPKRAKGRLGSGERSYQQMVSKVAKNARELSYEVKNKVAYIFNGERVLQSDVTSYKQDFSQWLNKDGTVKEVKFNPDGMPARQGKRKTQ